MQNSNTSLTSTWENLYGSHVMARKRTSLKGLALATSRQGVYKHMCAKVLCEGLPYCFSEKDGEVLKGK